MARYSLKFFDTIVDAILEFWYLILKNVNVLFYKSFVSHFKKKWSVLL